MPGTMGKSVADAERGRAGMLVAHRVDMITNDHACFQTPEVVATRTRPMLTRALQREDLCFRCALQRTPWAPREKAALLAPSWCSYVWHISCSTTATAAVVCMSLVGPTSLCGGMLFAGVSCVLLIVLVAFRLCGGIFFWRSSWAVQWAVGCIRSR